MGKGDRRRAEGGEDVWSDCGLRVGGQGGGKRKFRFAKSLLVCSSHSVIL